eukprot:365048-Hanusia_phi.AAC.1
MGNQRERKGSCSRTDKATDTGVMPPVLRRSSERPPKRVSDIRPGPAQRRVLRLSLLRDETLIHPTPCLSRIRKRQCCCL